MDKNLKAPKTLEEIGIHLFYMNQEILELKETMKEMPNGFAQIKDVAGLESRVATLESKNDFKQTLLWVGLVASAIINIVVIYKLFTGK